MNYKIILLIVIFASLFIAGYLTGYISQQGHKGILEGHVTIGPLCPVEPCHITSEQMEKVYASRKILVFDESGKLLVVNASIDKNGSYSVELYPGNYVVDIPHTGIGGSGDVPREIKIRSEKIVRLDITIDTGIR